MTLPKTFVDLCFLSYIYFVIQRQTEKSEPELMLKNVSVLFYYTTETLTMAFQYFYSKSNLLYLPLSAIRVLAYWLMRIEYIERDHICPILCSGCIHVCKLKQQSLPLRVYFDTLFTVFETINNDAIKSITYYMFYSIAFTLV